MRLLLIFTLYLPPLSVADETLGEKCWKALRDLSGENAASLAQGKEHIHSWHGRFNRDALRENTLEDDFREPEDNFSKIFPNGKGREDFDAMARLDGLKNDVDRLPPENVSIFHAEGRNDSLELLNQFTERLKKIESEVNTDRTKIGLALGVAGVILTGFELAVNGTAESALVSALAAATGYVVSKNNKIVVPNLRDIENSLVYDYGGPYPSDPLSPKIKVEEAPRRDQNQATDKMTSVTLIENGKEIQFDILLSCDKDKPRLTIAQRRQP